MPTKKKITLPDGWKEGILLLYEEGASKHEILSYLKINKSQHANLISENEEYASVIDRGEVMARAWWESIGRKNIANGKFNTTLFAFMYKTRFGIAAGEESEKDAVFNDKIKQQELLRKYNIQKIG